MTDSTNIQAPVKQAVDPAHSQQDTGRPQPPRIKTRGKVRLLLALSLAAGALVTVYLGLLERYLFTAPHPIPYFHLFFSDTLYMKAWLASATLVLAAGQLITAAGMYGVLRTWPRSRFYQIVHPWSGRIAMLLTLPVAFNCLFELGLNEPDLRIIVHSILGAFIYGIFVAKFLLIRVDRAPGWLLPILGSALFATILGLWLTSAYWLFNVYGWHL